MCDDYEFEIVKRAFQEQMARRSREKAESDKGPRSSDAPAKPTEPAPRVRDKEPTPA